MKKAMVSAVLALGLCILPGLARAEFNFSPYFSGGLSYLNMTNQDLIVQGASNPIFNGTYALDYKGGYSVSASAGVQLLNESRATPWFGIAGGYNFAKLDKFAGDPADDGSMHSFNIGLAAGLDIELAYGFYLNFGGNFGYANMTLDSAQRAFNAFEKYNVSALHGGATAAVGKSWMNGLFVQGRYGYTWLHEYSNKATITNTFDPVAVIKVEGTRYQTFGIDIGFSF